MIDEIVLDGLRKVKSGVNAEFFRGKNVLVTGGSGFIGSWLCDVLVNSDANVTCVDDFSTGRISNVEHLLGKASFKLVKESVCDWESQECFDVILHMAGHASPEEYMGNPIETLLTSADGTKRVAEIARKNGATLLFASTSEVYGDAEIVPTPESYWGKVNPIGQRSCYDEGKRFAESLLMAYGKKYGLDVRIARIFNTYGPRLRADGFYGRAMSRFITQALTGAPITVYGDGTQTRSFCYITDTVTALLLMLEKNVKGEVVNVGNSEEITILLLAEKIQRSAKSKSGITYQPLPQDDPKRRCPDTSKLEKLVSWKPRVTLDFGLTQTVEWFSLKKT